MPLEMRAKEPLFHNGEFPDLSKLDISEIAELKRQNKIELQNFKISTKDDVS